MGNPTIDDVIRVEVSLFFVPKTHPVYPPLASQIIEYQLACILAFVFAQTDSFISNSTVMISGYSLLIKVEKCFA